MRRRMFLGRIVAGFSVVAGAAFLLPFLKSWLPARRHDPFLDIRLQDLQPGRVKRVIWLGRTVFLARRSDNSIAAIRLADDSRLDPDSRGSRQPGFAANSLRSHKSEVFVAFANCTHLGCEVVARFAPSGGLLGFSCPCHQSEFDAAGRVARGGAAKYNLAVPHYEHLPDGIIRLGLPGSSSQELEQEQNVQSS